MNVSRFELNPFGENTYILWHKLAKKAIVVDPGMMRDDECQLVVDFLDRHELTLQAVMLTHIHIDHVTGAKWLADKYDVKILASKADEFLASTLPLQAQLFGLKIEVPVITIDQALKKARIPRITLSYGYSPVKPAGTVLRLDPLSALHSADDLFSIRFCELRHVALYDCRGAASHAVLRGPVLARTDRVRGLLARRIRREAALLTPW